MIDITTSLNRNGFAALAQTKVLDKRDKNYAPISPKDVTPYDRLNKCKKK
jgi:hypothetical protein